MSNANAFRIGTLCILLAILCMPPHVPAVDGVLGGVCAIYLFLIVSGYRRADARSRG